MWLFDVLLCCFQRVTAIQQEQQGECVVQQETSVRVNQTTLEPNVTSVPRVTTASQSADVSILICQVQWKCQISRVNKRLVEEQTSK